MHNGQIVASAAKINSTKKTPKLSLKSLMNGINMPTRDESKKSPIEESRCSTPINNNHLKMNLAEFDDLMINVKSLGLDRNLNDWIDSKKNDSIMFNSSMVSKDRLESDKIRLHEMQGEISDKFVNALNSISIQILCKLPGFDPDVYQRLVILNNHVKARIRQTNRKLLSLDPSLQLKNENKLILSESCNKYSNSSKESTAVVNNMDLTINDKSNESIKSNDCISETKKVSCLNLFKNFGNTEINFAASSTLILNDSGVKRKSTFQPKKPSTVTSAVSQPSNISQPSKKSEMEKKCEEVKLWNDEVNSAFSTRSTSCKTSSSNAVLHNGDIVDLNIEDEIIKIHPQDFFNSSFGFNNSKGHEFQESPNTEEFLKQLPDVSGIKKSAIKNNANNCTEVQLNKSKNNVSTSTIQFIGDVTNDSIGGGFNNLDFPHCRQMVDVFRKKFGLHQFRPNQLSAINATILGHDCFILMPTGGGKSLCYQLPALIASGITIVISPLRSLIIDQTQKLLSLDIPAMYLTGDVSDEQALRTYRLLLEPQPSLKLLYVTPEKISKSPKFWNSLKSLYERGMLSRFVIDEVHCVSQWGHDFRPDYKKLSVLKEKFPGVPLIALTATATQRVRSDILHQLHIDSPKWFISSFNRPNLRYSVINKKSKSSGQQVVDIIKSKFKNECGIVYCISRKDCDEHAEALVKKGVSALSYHAGLEDKLRIERQSQWIAEKVKVICATIAFGMGIDKPNVRFVLHAAMSKSIEGYYQESGRAGRDGDLAECILMYSYGDVHRYRRMMETDEHMNAEAFKTHLDNLYKMVHFCENIADCRRALQLNYFGEKFDRQECINNPATACDNCRTYDQFENMDVTHDAKALVQLIQNLENVRKNNVTILQVVDIYKGCDVSTIKYKLGYNYHTWFGKGQSMTKYEIERLLHNLVIEGYLCENMQLNNGIICAYVAPGKYANEFLNQDNIQIFLQKKKVVQKNAPKPSIPEMSGVTDASVKDLEQRCYTELLEMINGIAGALDVSANSIMNMVALRAMSQQLPKNENDMLKLPHVTKANFDKYGMALLDITQKYAKEKEVLFKEENKNNTRTSFEFDDSEHDSEWGHTNDRKKFKSSNDNFDDNHLSKLCNTNVADRSWSSSNTRNQSTNGRGKRFNTSKRRYKSSGSKRNKIVNNDFKARKNSRIHPTKIKGPGFCELTNKKVKKEN